MNFDKKYDDDYDSNIGLKQRLNEPKSKQSMGLISQVQVISKNNLEEVELPKNLTIKEV